MSLKVVTAEHCDMAQQSWCCLEQEVANEMHK